MPSGGHRTGTVTRGQILGCEGLRFHVVVADARHCGCLLGKWQVWPREGLSPLGAQSVWSQELDSLIQTSPLPTLF